MSDNIEARLNQKIEESRKRKAVYKQAIKDYEEMLHNAELTDCLCENKNEISRYKKSNKKMLEFYRARLDEEKRMFVDLCWILKG